MIGVTNAEQRAQAPFVVRNEFFGGLVYARDRGSYLSFDEDLIKVLRLSCSLSLDEIFAQVYGARACQASLTDKDYRKDFEQLVNCFRSYSMFENDRFQGVFIDNEVPSSCDSLTAPLAVNLQLTNYCQFTCKHCWIDRARSNQVLSKEDVKKLLRQLADAGVFVVNFGGGQAIARSDFSEIARFANSLGLRLNLSVNVSNLTDAYMRRLIDVDIASFKVGIAAGNEKSWENVRNGNAFKQFKRGLEKLAAYVGERPQSGIVFSAVLCKDNCGELVNIISFVNGCAQRLNLSKPLLKVGLALPVPGANGQIDADAFMSSSEIEGIVSRINEYQNNKTSAEIVEVQADFAVPSQRGSAWPNERDTGAVACKCGTLSCYISERGYVYPSGILSRVLPAHDANDLRKHSLTEIWLSEAMSNFRRVKVSEPCRSCEHLAYCHGGCRSRAYLFSKNCAAIDPWCSLHHTLEKNYDRNSRKR